MWVLAIEPSSLEDRRVHLTIAPSLQPSDVVDLYLPVSGSEHLGARARGGLASELQVLLRTGCYPLRASGGHAAAAAVFLHTCRGQSTSRTAAGLRGPSASPRERHHGWPLLHRANAQAPRAPRTAEPRVGSRTLTPTPKHANPESSPVPLAPAPPRLQLSPAQRPPRREG